MRERYVRANGIRFRCLESGEGPLCLLLHGFPETSYTWRHQIAALAEHFHVVAPDLRGYGGTDRPPRGYDLPTLVDDASGLIRAIDGEAGAAHVVGHDWGGVIAFGLASAHPRAVKRICAIDGPHAGAYLREIAGGNVDQLRKSWYIGFFQLPLVPELLIRRDLEGFLERVFHRTPRERAAFRREDLDVYRRALEPPGALEAGLEYYRSLRRIPPSRMRPLLRRIKAPTLVIWGADDAALDGRIADAAAPWVERLRVVKIDGAGHFVHEEEPARVTRLLLDFLVPRRPQPSTT